MAVRDMRPLLPQVKDAISEIEAARILWLPLSVLPSLVDRGLIHRLEANRAVLAVKNEAFLKIPLAMITNTLPPPPRIRWATAHLLVVSYHGWITVEEAAANDAKGAKPKMTMDRIRAWICPKRLPTK
jgi:hypothetical protein